MGLQIIEWEQAVSMTGSPAFSVYSATKAAVRSFARTWSVDLRERKIRVNAISPGWTEDSVLNSLDVGVQELIRNWHKRGATPMGRLGTPEDVGNVAALLCSDQANWITGQVIYVDIAELSS